ncbi:MAG TPA: winged helix-turn-helix transcriptional regulator [Clostridia bacterium]|jgi:ArsR family transcriptional regulator|nr:winged helix-turn-helix transcriptional regulator [Clostridia bacterium]
MSEREIIDFCKALSDETRLKIIQLLNKEDTCVYKLAKYLDMAQPRISRHLQILRAIDLVEDRRDGQLVYYSLNKEKFNQYYKMIEKIISQ